MTWSGRLIEDGQFGWRVVVKVPLSEEDGIRIFDNFIRKSRVELSGDVNADEVFDLGEE